LIDSQKTPNFLSPVFSLLRISVYIVRVLEIQSPLYPAKTEIAVNLPHQFLISVQGSISQHRVE
jgi:hypothetical protein